MPDFVVLDGVTWTAEPIAHFEAMVATIEARFGPPAARDLDSNGLGLFDAYCLRFSCGLEIALWRWHFYGRDARTIDPAIDPAVFTVHANPPEVEHARFHLGIGESWRGDAEADRRQFTVMRTDDNANEVEVKSVTSRCEAEAIVHEYKARLHKQLYWILAPAALVLFACGSPRVEPTRNVVAAAVPIDAAVDAPIDAVVVDAAPRQTITFIHGAGGGADPAEIDEKQRRCDANDNAGCHALALALMTPGDPSSPNNARAFTAFDKACTNGYAPSCNGLGVMYAEGLGVPRDEAKAVAIQRKACIDGSVTACQHVAMAYEHGRGVPQNTTEAAAYYKRACKLGSSGDCKR